jgi:hypothetical protein
VPEQLFFVQVAQLWVESQSCPLAQLPQLKVPPQPSGREPHVALSALHVVGEQQACVPSHVCPVAQSPQLKVPPQPSGMEPHAALCAAHVVGVQATQL